MDNVWSWNNAACPKSHFRECWITCGADTRSNAATAELSIEVASVGSATNRRRSAQSLRRSSIFGLGYATYFRLVDFKFVRLCSKGANFWLFINCSVGVTHVVFGNWALCGVTWCLIRLGRGCLWRWQTGGILFPGAELPRHKQFGAARCRRRDDDNGRCWVGDVATYEGRL